MNKKSVLLINLGTPDHCDAQSVRRYLKEFLNDPRVIDLPSLARWLLVNGIILPFRYKKSARAYQQIWQEEGSPLLVHSLAVTKALALKLGAGYQVELGMRYGHPTIQAALEKLSPLYSLTVIPLFPQYSSAATGSAIQALLSIINKKWNMPALHIVRDFYRHPGFIAAYSEVIKEHLAHQSVDLILFSYHGLPERHIHKSECHAHCDKVNACPLMNEQNQFCYRAQCYETSRLLAQSLNLIDNQYAVSFQSRLGRTPWIKPYTDFLLPDLIQQGIKKIAVVCPSFVADCLETLEEVNIRMREQWQSLGGTHFTFIPCLNSFPLWINALADIIQ